MKRTVGQALLGLVAAVLAMLGTAPMAAAQIHLNPAYGDGALLGPTMARGAVVWSHGRSVDVEDSNAPTPLYMKTMRDAGWDVFRLDRMRVSDTLPNSSRALAGYADQLKDRGYRKVVLTGQSFGAFLSLMAAGQSDRVDAVVGTAPAAFGNFSDSYDSFRDNAAQLWPILRGIHNARVMLFFFHGDDFDPGGRGESARGILSSRGLEHIVVDQPALLTGHGAATTGMFVRRFGSCILRFAEAPPRRGDPSCDESWGRTPSAELMRAAAPEPRTGSGTSSPAGTGARSFLGVWYGAYINGREIALAVDRVEGDAVYADYVLGPGMEADQPMERAQRKGRIENDELVFDEKGRNVLRYSIRTDGRLSATWLDRSGKGRLETTLRRMD
ncbi:alpha/beta hydrolase [Azospirillum sp. YIM DDC1]|uniref:Alpha/beta hydrolase n=1 Tax=Azospirillum aestuarii TaxID=2802052 RepID=A0ABS1I0X2_9PROT|nr:alpha/beta hydrolase [Azospirillum aestuarii]MBK3773788.1 alpha/beta hydrolase [Azospirillum brasilense]MBK4720730.1 alpha/beta hydrolase [Azospirillum aestuarii]